MAETPGYLWITSPGNSRIDQIRAGALYARANLAASAAGLAMHPVSQALQEYPEMDIEYKALHRRLNVVEPQRIQMLPRVGYAPTVAPAAPWGLEAKLRT